MKGFIGDVRFYDYINLISSQEGTNDVYVGSLATIVKPGTDVSTLYIYTGRMSGNLPTTSGTWKGLVHTITATGATVTNDANGTVNIAVDNTGDTLIKAICSTVDKDEIGQNNWKYTVQYPLEDVGITSIDSALDGKVIHVVQVYTIGEAAANTKASPKGISKMIDPNIQIGFIKDDNDKPLLLININFKDEAGWDYLVPTNHKIGIKGYYSNANATRNVAGLPGTQYDYIFDSPSNEPEPEDSSEGGE